MTAVAATTTDKVSSDSARQELATPSTDGLVQASELKHLRSVARAVGATRSPKAKPDRGASDIDYAAWHAHLAGTRRWTPDRQRGPSA